MALPPFDALTAALDALLGQHIANTTRRARVRRAVDCLDDLRMAPLAHIEFATDVSSWPAIPRLRFLRALRELRGEPVARARRDARVGRYEMEVVGALEDINEDIRIRQINAQADPDLLDFEWFLTPDGRFLTLLCTYADVLAQQRSFVRSMRNPLPESLMVLKSMRTYGSRALRLGNDPPPGWTEVMLLTEHQEPVGRRSFQR